MITEKTHNKMVKIKAGIASRGQSFPWVLKGCYAFGAWSFWKQNHDK